MKNQKFEIAVAGYDYRFRPRPGRRGGIGKGEMFSRTTRCRVYYPYSEVERLPAGNGILPQAGFTAMRKWIDQSTFDELLLANAEDNVERTIQSASAVLKIVQKFVPEAALFYRVTHAADSLKNYFEEACTGFRRTVSCFSSANTSIQNSITTSDSIGRCSDMRTTTPTARLSTSNPNRIVSGSSPKRRSTTGWNTSRRVSGISNGSMRRTNAK